MKNFWKPLAPARRTGRTGILVQGTGQCKIVRSAALWVALAIPVLLDSPSGPNSPPMWWRLAGVLLLMTVTGFRKTRLPLSWCASAVLSLISPWFSPSLFVMSYLAGRRGDVRERPVVLAAAVGTVLTALGAIGITAAHITTWLNSAPLLVGTVTAWLAGRHRHQRRELELAGWQHAQHLEREHQLAADRVRIRERARIAQDMHDQLGHDLTLIAMQAAALEVAPMLDESVRSTAGELRRSTAQAIGSLSDIIGVLRLDTEREPASPPEDLMTTVYRARTAGMLVGVRRLGRDIPAPPVIEEAARRVVQEALTNAAKHAPGAEVLVRIERLTEQTVVTVTNAPSDRPSHGAAGSSMGLVGLSERAGALGGTLSARPRDDGGFEVSARLPHSRVQYGSGDGGQDAPAEAPLTDTAQRRAEQQVRRSLATLLAVPVAAAVVCAVMVLYVYKAFHSVTLDAAMYRSLTVGERWEDLRTVLPTQQTHVEQSTERPPPPAHAACKYYRAGGGGLFSMEARTYRLCFIDGKLTSKDKLGENKR